jgi:prepilin-type N-terminal cleavage/methylation domain-containing protein
MEHILKIRNRRGFSLVEIFIAIAILVIVLTIAMPAFTRYKKNINLRNAARALAADFAYLKQKAITESVHYKIVLSAENNNYKIIKGGSNGISSEYDETTAIVKSPSAFSNGIVISANPAPTYPQSQVIFQPRGTTSAGTIVLANDFGSIATIVSGLTGRVHVSFNMN